MDLLLFLLSFKSRAQRFQSFYGYFSGSAKAVERPCAREERHHDIPFLEPGRAVRKITFLKQPREMGLLMIKQPSARYYASKLELPWNMPEDRYGALGREDYLFRSGRESRY